MGSVALDLFLTPACALIAGVVVWLNSRRHALEDGELVRLFLIVLAICIAVGIAVLRTDFARARLQPGFKTQQQIAAQPAMAALQRVAPDDFGKLLGYLAATPASGSAPADLMARARPMLVALVNQRLGFADQQAKIGWGRVVVSSLRELQAHSPAACYRALAERVSVPPAGMRFSADNAQAFDLAVIAVYESAQRTMERKPSATNVPGDFTRAGVEFSEIQGRLSERFGSTVARAVAKQPFPLPSVLPAETMCAASIAQLEAMLARPQATAATLVDGFLR